MAEQAMSVEERISDFLRIEEEGEAPQETEQPQAQAQPEKVNETEVQESTTEDTKASEVQEATEETQEGEVEEIEVSSFSDLAEHLNVDVADLYNIPIPVNTPDGKKEISIGEWKDSVQAAENLKAERAKLAEQVQQREDALKKFTEAIDQNMAQTQAVIEMASAELMRDYQAVNWAELRQIDPAEFAAKQQEFGQRHTQIENAKQQALQQWQQAQEQQRQMLQESLPDQQKKLVELIPSWSDESTASAEKAKVADFLAKQGFSEEDISNLYDARAVSLAWKAMKYDELKSSNAPATKKRLKIGNKPIKPGKSQSKSEQRETQNRDQRVKLKKSGDVRDLAALLNTDEYLGDM